MDVSVQIQASTIITNTTLQAEALALLLAAQVTKRLCISQPTFFTDNLSLASWAASRKIKESTTPWTIRKVLLSSSATPQIFSLRCFTSLGRSMVLLTM